MKSAALLLLLSACATPDVVCDMKADYETVTRPFAQGTVTVRWLYDANLPENTYGTTECWPSEIGRFCLIKMKGPEPSYHNVCGMAKQMHEFMHAQGAKHAKN